MRPPSKERRAWFGRWSPLVVILGVALGPVEARAYMVSTSVTEDCHERFTLAAIARVGWPDGRTAPAPTRDAAALARDLPFSVPPEQRDVWTIALLFGARHPDLGDADPEDVAALARIAAEPGTQGMHFLREAEHDYSEGDGEVIATTRRRIREQVDLALGGGDTLDPAEVEWQSVRLAFSGRIDLPLSRFAFHMGMALHALQDGFSHAFRDPATSEVRHVLNYVDPLRDGYREERDGHRHLNAMDRCESSSEPVVRRAAWATEASTQLLAAVASGEGGRAGRLARVEAVLDRWFQRAEGCTYENGYCDAGEPYEDSAGCSAAPAGHRAGGPLLGLSIGLLVYLFTRRRRTLAAETVWLAIALPTGASADAPEDVLAPSTEAAVASAPRAEPRARERFERRLGPALTILGGLDDAVVGGALGFRYEPAFWFALGLDVDYQAWISLSSENVTHGVMNFAAVGQITYGSFGAVSLRGSVSLGVSTLLVDLVAAERGATGPFFGANPLGIAIAMNETLRFTFDPGGIYFAIPQLGGIPLIHRHHRFSVGMQLMY